MTGREEDAMHLYTVLPPLVIEERRLELQRAFQTPRRQRATRRLRRLLAL
jgi:hypothetical protein